MIREPVVLDLTAGVRPEDAPALFAHAAGFYACLPADLDAWPERFNPTERRGFAAERRRLLHVLLDHALDVIEITGAVERAEWP
jgi:hypothetical protein